jgi:hypothetical protein
VYLKERRLHHAQLYKICNLITEIGRLLLGEVEPSLSHIEGNENASLSPELLLAFILSLWSPKGIQ